MLLRSSMLLGAHSGVTFVNSAVNTASTTTVTKPANLAAGDLVVVIVPFVTVNIASVALTIATPNGAWSSAYDVGVGNGSAFCSYRILTTNDLTDTWTVTGSGGVTETATEGTIALHYKANGATTVTHKTLNGFGTSTSPTSDTLTGFTPAVNTKGVLALTTLVGGSSLSTTTPSGFTSRVASSFGSVFDQIRGYGGGSVSMTMTFSGSASGSLFGLLEVT